MRSGKTVVALYRCAYLLYSEPRISHLGGVLFVGPHRPYLSHVADVLPSLGENRVHTCTLRDLVDQGATAASETDHEVAGLKSSVNLVKAVEAAVKFYEKPPGKGIMVGTPWSDIWLSAEDWVEAFSAPEPGTPHNEAFGHIWEALLAILVDNNDAEVSTESLRASLEKNGELRNVVTRFWPILEAPDIVGDLWSVPAYLRKSAPWLGPNEVLKLQREYMDTVIDNLVEADDGEGLVTSLIQQDLQDALVSPESKASVGQDPLIGPFAHIVVDEAQELTDAHRKVLPDANVPISIRATQTPVIYGSVTELESTLKAWLCAHVEGIACVIGFPRSKKIERVQFLSPELSKGLEFDLVILYRPEYFGTGIEGAVDRYVAMIRATQRLVILR